MPEDTRSLPQVFVKNLATGAVALVSKSPTGQAGDGPSGLARLSATGEYIVFLSLAENLVPGDTNGKQDVFVTHNPLFIR